MLITIALFAAVQAAGPQVPTAEPEMLEEVRVIGRKLRDWRGSLKTKGGVARCVTKRSTGDRDVDRIGCEAMLACFPKFEGEFKAALSTAPDKASRDRGMMEISQRLTACVQERHDRLAEALADRRADERS